MDPVVHTVLEALGSDQAVEIAYHMSWPASNDPFYLANPGDNDARRGYYGINAIPALKCDGSTIGTSQYAIESAINSRLAVDSPLRLDLELNVLGDQLDVTCYAFANQNVSGNVVIHFALVDRYEYLPASPNGQPHHYASLLKMAPSASGQVFEAVAGDTAVYSATIALDSSWALEDLDLVCFVQDNSTREVLQAKLVSIPLDFPNILVADYEVSDPTGNGDGRVDPGETGEMVVTLQNQEPFHDAVDVNAVLSTDDPLITVTNAAVNFPDIPSGATGQNTSEPFTFDVDPQFEAHEVTFDLTVTAEPGGFEAVYPLTFMVGRPDILVVNDDLNGAYLSWYEEALDEIGAVYDSWTQVQSGSLPQDEMDRYFILIWYTGDDAISTISEDEQNKIQNFIENGGRLFLSSQNAGDLLGGTAFYEEVLHAEHLENTVNEFLLNGVAGDPISDGTNLFLGGAGGAGNAVSSSSLAPLDPAVGIYTYPQAGTYAALRLQTETSRIVYCAFAVEAVSPAGGFTPRSELFDNSIQWLSGEVGVAPGRENRQTPTTVTLAPLYPNPFNPTVEIRFYLPGAGFTDLSVFNLAGKQIARLTGKTLQTGWHTFTWDAADLSAGIYIVRLESGGSVLCSKAVFLK